MLLDGFFQNAYVTRNLDKAVALAKERHGAKDIIYFDPEMEVNTVHGRGLIKVKVALTWLGPLQLELIEPVSGLSQHYDDYLPADDSPRFHHVGIRSLDWKKTRDEIARNKWPVAYEGGVEGVEFAYIDARDSLGHYVEYVWFSPEMWKATGGR
jgi:hypothetical protein